MRDPRSNESELPTTEVRGDRLQVSETLGTQIWALYPAATHPERSEATGAGILRVLPEVAREGRRFLMLGALFGVVFGIVYLLWADSVYVVKALLHVEVRDSVLREYAEVRSGSNFVATQAEVIQSPEMIGDAIRAIGIPTPEAAGFLVELKQKVKAIVLGAPAPADPLAAAVLATLPVLQASPVLGTDIMAVTLRTDDPERGSRLLEALIGSYRHYVRENETAAHREGLQLLHEREAELSVQIAELSDRYQAQRSQIQLLGDQDDALSVQRMGLEEQAKARVEAQRRRVELENELGELRAQSDLRIAPDPKVIEDLARAEASLSELRATVSPRHPDVRQMEQQVAGLREQLHQGGVTRIEDLEREARAARKSEARLAELYDHEWQKVQALEGERAGVKKLGDEVARLEEQRKAVLQLLGEKELSMLAQGSEHSGTLIRVLEAPAVPPAAIWPLPIPVLGACGFVGLLGGLGYALWAQQRREAGHEAEPVHLESAPARLAQRRVPEL